ncbi:MAG TPA: hypothetical protein DCY75_05775 [Clostridiales bacterium]|nr:hypothetical protein [Clostridiales bacterium]
MATIFIFMIYSFLSLDSYRFFWYTGYMQGVDTLEKIYTIPVNEVFEEQDGCPFCHLYQKLENNHLDIILGAAMMEDDVRSRTNIMGFCGKHYKDMLHRKNRLSLALMLDTHIATLQRNLDIGSPLFKDKASKMIEVTSPVNTSCYVCQRIEHDFSKMMETAALLWDMDKEFRKKFASQPFFCLPHYQRMIENAKRIINKKILPDFLREAETVENAYLAQLHEDIQWFCKKFDYRYTNEPWGNAKDSIERAIHFFSGKIEL